MQSRRLRALWSEERRDYIASFLKNGLTNEEMTHVQQKKLLSILGELNDAEIIFLRYESVHPNNATGIPESHHWRKRQSNIKIVAVAC
jgi:hypothetical protein